MLEVNENPLNAFAGSGIDGSPLTLQSPSVVSAPTTLHDFSKSPEKPEEVSLFKCPVCLESHVPPIRSQSGYQITLCNKCREQVTSSKCEISNRENENENRHKAFVAFVKNVPRICSPTMCTSLGLMSPIKEEGNGGCDTVDGGGKGDDFNWSIDQLATLDPCDISYDPSFNQAMTNFYDGSLEREDEEFFNQLEILPSPAVAVTYHQSHHFDSTHMKTMSPLLSLMRSATKSRIDDAPLDFSTPVSDSNNNKSILRSATDDWIADQIPSITPCHDIPRFQYTPCTPPPSRSRSASSSALLTPNYNFIKTRNKKKLFCDN